MAFSHLCRIDKKAAFFLPPSVWGSLFRYIADSLKAGATQLKSINQLLDDTGNRH